MSWPKNSVNAWMMGGVSNPIDSRVYNSIDMLSMGFPKVAMVSEAQKKWNDPPPYPDGYIIEDQDWLPNVTSAAKAGNATIKLLVLLNYGTPKPLSIIFNGSTDTATMKMDAKMFAKNVVSYLKHYGLDGVDIDWEPNLSNTTSAEQFVIIFEAMRAEFGTRGNTASHYLALSPAPNTNLLPVSTATGETYNPGEAINTCFDLVTLQNYYAGDYPTYPMQFTDAPPNGVGINTDLIAFGVKFESHNSQDPSPFQNAQSAYNSYHAGINNNSSTPYIGTTTWRMNSGNYEFEQAQQMMLYRMINPSSTFSDIDIVSIAGKPPVSQLNIRHGDVVDAVEAINTGSFTMNGITVPLTYSLPHGGLGGEVTAIDIAHDPVIEISGFTGYWYGNPCVLQITIKQQSGKTHSFPSRISSTATDQQPFSFSAPAGSTSFAFSGVKSQVATAQGGTATIIKSLTVDYFS